MTTSAPIASNEGHCLNCGAGLTGRFCAQCGQKAQVHRSLGAFFSDLVAGLFNFESRFWRTLPMLAWCPGDLTRRYVDGQRARFISPIALYLFSVFLMFAALTATTGDLVKINLNNDIDRSIASAEADVRKLETERAAAVSAGRPAATIDRKLASAREDLDQLHTVRDGKFSSEIAEEGSNAPPWLINAVRKFEGNPREAMGHVQEAASKYSWALIPFSLPFMLLLFPFRRRHVFDHAVFVTYSLSFMMLLILAGSLMALVGAGGWVPLLLLLPPIHMYRQLKGAYRLRWWSALARTGALLVFAFIALTLFGLAMVALGVIA